MKLRKNDGISGIIVVDKPVGMTSFRVDSLIKKELNCSKVGHAGTLDPFATGVLPILLNKATKLQDNLINIPKSYEGTFKLGMSTDTLDILGASNGNKEVTSFELKNIVDYLSKLKGDFVQKIPAFSAKKYKGVPLYKYARKHVDIIPDNPTSVVKIYEFEVKSYDNPYINFKCTVSKGTYVRAMAQDIMDKFDMPAHLYSLKRTNAGGFDISEALPLESLEKGVDFITKNIIPMNSLKIDIAE
ncbi:tRNA pseudouridine(55) synthase TruB [Candidatus Acidulodesulfobacterium sp. H_13]|uniref:tRNA pseudouridine(55) synthase TruB n=1 Tax=Candidatus Acidulodesulfobacterium sp. H_13 TaxID=3395470 RepID=UPI003AF4DA6D